MIGTNYIDKSSIIPQRSHTNTEIILTLIARAPDEVHFARGRLGPGISWHYMQWRTQEKISGGVQGRGPAS